MVEAGRELNAENNIFTQGGNRSWRWWSFNQDQQKNKEARKQTHAYTLSEQLTEPYIRNTIEARDGRRYVACDLELWPIKNSFCAFLARVKTYTDTNIKHIHLLVLIWERLQTPTSDDDDDPDDAGRHSTTSRATYRQ